MKPLMPYEVDNAGWGHPGQDEAASPPMLDEAIQDEAGMLVEAVRDESARPAMLDKYNPGWGREVANAGRGWTTIWPNYEPEFS